MFESFTAAQIGVAFAAALGSAFVRGLTGFGMAILHLLAFDFARQMREAPDEK